MNSFLPTHRLTLSEYLQTGLVKGPTPPSDAVGGGRGGRFLSSPNSAPTVRSEIFHVSHQSENRATKLYFGIRTIIAYYTRVLCDAYSAKARALYQSVHMPINFPSRPICLGPKHFLHFQSDVLTIKCSHKRSRLPNLIFQNIKIEILHNIIIIIQQLWDKIKSKNSRSCRANSNGDSLDEQKVTEMSVSYEKFN